MLLSYDTETTGLRPFQGDKMFAWSTCDADGNPDVKRLDKKQNNIPELRELMRKGKNELCMHNAKFDIIFTEQMLGKKLAEDLNFHDVYLEAHLLRNNRHSYKLKDLSWELGGIPKDDEAAIKPYTTGPDDKVDYSLVPEHLMHEYQVKDAERTMLLHLFFIDKLKEDKRLWECYQMELDLIRTTIRMEERGFCLDVKRCKSMSEECTLTAADTLDEAEAMLGTRINLGNDTEVRRLLFTTFGMKPLKYTATGKPSVDKGSLDELGKINHNPILDLVIKYRSYRSGSSMLSSYLDFCDEDGIIHPSINTCQARTARQSSNSPNLQNVQKEAGLLNKFPIPARKAFKPRPGYVNLYMDFKGVQFRIAVSKTGNKKLLDLAVNDDLHSIGASILLGPKWKKADAKRRKLLRSAGKNANFSKMFGGGIAKTGATLGMVIPPQRFKEYDKIFGPLSDSAKTIIRKARKYGYVETSFGRKLYIPSDKPYVGVNYEIQGDEAEVVKRAEIRASKILNEETSGEANLIMVVHDELVIEWPRKRLNEAKPILRKVRDAITDFPMFAIPLEVDCEVATINWSTKNTFSLED